jgi:hypothetical protein
MPFEITDSRDEISMGRKEPILPTMMTPHADATSHIKKLMMVTKKKSSSMDENDGPCDDLTDPMSKALCHEIDMDWMINDLSMSLMPVPVPVPVPVPTSVPTMVPTMDRTDTTAIPSQNTPRFPTDHGNETTNVPSLSFLSPTTPTTIINNNQNMTSTIAPTSTIAAFLPTTFPSRLLPTTTTSSPSIVVPSSNSSSLSCDTMSRDMMILNLLSTITMVSMLQDIATPQGLAYQWIVFNDPMQLNPCWPTGGATIDDTISQILLQRYSIVVLYYSTHGNTWIISNNNWLSNQSICEWDYITCDNTDGTLSIVQQIVLGTFV